MACSDLTKKLIFKDRPLGLGAFGGNSPTTSTYNPSWTSLDQKWNIDNRDQRPNHFGFEFIGTWTRAVLGWGEQFLYLLIVLRVMRLLMWCLLYLALLSNVVTKLDYEISWLDILYIKLNFPTQLYIQPHKIYSLASNEWQKDSCWTTSSCISYVS